MDQVRANVANNLPMSKLDGRACIDEIIARAALPIHLLCK